MDNPHECIDVVLASPTHLGLEDIPTKAKEEKPVETYAHLLHRGHPKS